MRAAQEKPGRETDLYAWLLHQAKELRARQPNFLDWSELAEELDEIVALARKETVSRLRTVLVHLLKWKYQTKRRDERSWKTTIVRERLDLSLLLESKNLRSYMLHKGHALAYHQARSAAGDEMQLERRVWDRLFPQICEWSLDQALNDEFFPAYTSDANQHSH
jgi:Domain of unknown function DUF29